MPHMPLRTRPACMPTHCPFDWLSGDLAAALRPLHGAARGVRDRSRGGIANAGQHHALAARRAGVLARPCPVPGFRRGAPKLPTARRAARASARDLEAQPTGHALRPALSSPCELCKNGHRSILHPQWPLRWHLTWMSWHCRRQSRTMETSGNVTTPFIDDLMDSGAPITC